MKKNILVIAGILVFFFLIFYSSHRGAKIEEISFEIKRGDGVREIALHLKNVGVIRSTIYFYLYAFFSGANDSLQAGTYLLDRRMSTGKIISKFRRGDTIFTDIELTIIPGWTLKDIAQNLEFLGLFQAEELEELLGFPGVDYKTEKTMPKPYDFSSQFSFLVDKPKNVGYEGYLYPDTYRMAKDSSLKSVVEKILANFDIKFAEDLRAEIKKQKKSIFDIVRMASIIEKEVRTYEDKRVVSGILWKRIKAGMPLQVDATLNYVLYKTSKQLTVGDLKIQSPYNTYVNLGLPFTPVSNPGIKSIRAAIYPENSDYWYYLSADDGRTIFSRDFEEHKAAKAKYLK